MERTCDVVGGSILACLRPLGGVLRAEIRPVSLTVGVVDQAACLDLGQFLNRNFAGRGHGGIGNGGRRDGCLADLQRLDLAVVNGDRGSIGALPGNALVCSQPRIDVCLQGDGRALEQRDLRGKHLDAGYLCIIGKRDRVGRNNEQADNVITEEAAGAVGQRSGVGCRINNPELVVRVSAALKTIGTGKIQLAAGLIVGHRCVAVDPRAAGIEALAGQRQCAVLDVIRRPLIELEN